MKTSSITYLGISSLCIAVWLSTGVAVAEEVTDEPVFICEQKLSLEAFRAYALNNSSLVAEIDRGYAEDLAKAFEVEALQNPELQLERTYTRMNVGGANDPQSQISFGQPFRLSNFGARGKVAELIKKSGDLQKRSKMLELSQKIVVQYKTLMTYEKMRSLIADSESRAAKKVALIRDGVQKGLLSQGDEKLFEGEKYRLQAQVKNISSTMAILQSDISRTLGIACGVATVVTEEKHEIPSVDELVEKSKSSNISEMARINILANLAKEQVRLAELDVFPQITPRFIYQHTNDGGDFYGAGLSIPLPFWNQNQAEKTRASSEARVAQIKMRFVDEGGLANQIRNLRAAAVNAHEQADIFSQKVIPAFESALRSQEKQYSEGKGNILQVWQTLRAYNEAQTQGLEIWLQAAIARAELSVLVGEEI